jgi:hypothetical protein
LPSVAPGTAWPLGEGIWGRQWIDRQRDELIMIEVWRFHSSRRPVSFACWMHSFDEEAEIHLTNRSPKGWHPRNIIDRRGKCANAVRHGDAAVDRLGCEGLILDYAASRLIPMPLAPSQLEIRTYWVEPAISTAIPSLRSASLNAAYAALKQRARIERRRVRPTP